MRLRGEGGSVAISHLLPLRRGKGSQAISDGAAAIFINPPDRNSRLAIGAVSDMFSLTKAETAVLARLLAGLEPVRIASEFNVSDSTVRSHIRALLAKTDTHRLHELVARINNLMSGQDVPTN
jgi:DNA-binding CsgD family transcriptional regulator